MENFTEKFLLNGFKVEVPENGFSPKNNWFGVSVYTPNLLMTRGGKSLTMSYSGTYAPCDLKIYERYKELWDSCSIRYICLLDDKNVIYETWTGDLPLSEIVEDFIK